MEEICVNKSEYVFKNKKFLIIKQTSDHYKNIRCQIDQDYDATVVCSTSKNDGYWIIRFFSLNKIESWIDELVKRVNGIVFRDDRNKGTFSFFVDDIDFLC